MSNRKEDLLKQIPSISELLASATVEGWLSRQPRKLVTDCLRQAVENLRGQILADSAGRRGAAHVTPDFLLLQAGRLLEEAAEFHLRGAINATGILLHTGLGRAVLPECVVDSMLADLKGYVTLAIDRPTGLRSDRHHRVEYILQELTGAEAALVVNNNAAATVLALAALGAGRETVVSRGQLIEIGGSFRLPDVMAASGTRMVEVGTTNRTHLADYERAVSDSTAVILRVHPSNYRVVGFTSGVELADLAKLAHARGLILVDDLGAGALLDLRQFGLPEEPTVSQSIAAGADVVLFSADKLIGASQGGVIVGRKELVDRIARHPLARAFRADKTALMAIERTLHLFRDPQRLAKEHPLYRMLTTTPEALRQRAESLAAAIRSAVTGAEVTVAPGVAYLGSGSLPQEQLPSWTVRLSLPGVKADELARRLRMDQAAVFARIEAGAVVLDVRTLADAQVPLLAAAVARCAVEEEA